VNLLDQKQMLTAGNVVHYLFIYLGKEGHMEKKAGFSSIDEYILSFPEHVQKKLTELRMLIRQIAPDAQEKISYQIPTFYLNGNLVHFAAYSNHIGFYPTSSGIAKFEPELSKYKHAKGSVQFPLEEPLPVELIKEIVKYRVEENTKKGKKEVYQAGK
jgi:uncharacterized protein YdhG (YjbR/CyaY superfamily)